MTRLNERGRSAQVLLVEDNRGDAVLTRRAFRRARIANEIVVAESGEKGLAMLRREGEYAAAPTPDIILLDLNLPHMHGREFLSKVKDDPSLRRIPVIVLSSSSADNDIDACYTRHANGYITKPVSSDTYDNVVSRIEAYWFELMQMPSDAPAPTFS